MVVKCGHTRLHAVSLYASANSHFAELLCLEVKALCTSVERSDAD